MDTNGIPEIYDFAYDPSPKKFRIAPDIFTAAPDLPQTAYDLAISYQNISDTNARTEKVLAFFDAVLTDESAALLRERFASKVNTIGLNLLVQVLTWLLEQYGLRPTQPSSPSLVESQAHDGTNSTDGV